MLSCILNSEKAIAVNIRIIRIFTRLREMALTHRDILLKLEQIEHRLTGYDNDLEMIFTALKQLIQEPNPPRNPIGFKIDNKD